MPPRYPFLPLHKLSLTLLATSFTASAMAQGSTSPFADVVTIVGNKSLVSKINGSAYYIGNTQLQTFAYTDIERILREIPGLSVQLEDGYGLRPNISIRGVSSERSSRITLLEDNVLIAPAPYAASAAYYFPTAGRMSAIEVVKGPAAITQGPYTIGGALNMVSTPIPTNTSGNLLLEAATDTTYRLHATFGGWNQQGMGLLLETHQWQSQGFGDIDRTNGNTGFTVADYTLKLAYAPLASRHSMELKLQYNSQDSNQSYLGLTDADFSTNSTRRYGLSALDNISTAHMQEIMRYEFRANNNLKFTATAYNNEHKRSWYKTEGVDLDGAVTTTAMSLVNWFGIIDDVNLQHSRSGFTASQLTKILDGTANTPVNSIALRNNNRSYYSRGLQFALNWHLQTELVSHNLEASIRKHRDAEDRLQNDDSFQQLNGHLHYNGSSNVGSAGNEINAATATAIHVLDNINVGAWTLTPGLRFEDIDQQRLRFAGGMARTLRDSRTNKVQVWLPGLGVGYAINDEFSLLVGVHKGFSAPSNQPGVRQEEALNYELGLRLTTNRFNAEVMGFFSDYDNLLGVCTASSGADCNVGDAFNGDAVTVGGVEALLVADLSTTAQFKIPLQVNYTWMQGEFETNIANTAFFGNVSKGDRLPYIPTNQIRLALGLQQNLWGVNLSAAFVDEVCVKASCIVRERTDPMLTLDISGNYQFNQHTNIYARVENLSAENGIASRHPYGARPNKARTVSVGIRVAY